MGRAVAAGMTIAAASLLYSTSASAQEPRRGGALKMGIEGGASTDSLDPALAASQFPFIVSRTWGDVLVESHPFTGEAVPGLSARAELDNDKRKAMYHEMAMLVRDEGGTIVPMFNDFVNASTKQVKGYVHDIGNGMSNGLVASRVWLEG